MALNNSMFFGVFVTNRDIQYQNNVDILPTWWSNWDCDIRLDAKLTPLLNEQKIKGSFKDFKNPSDEELTIYCLETGESIFKVKLMLDILNGYEINLKWLNNKHIKES